MNPVKDKLADEEEELLENEDPFSCIYIYIIGDNDNIIILCFIA